MLPLEQHLRDSPSSQLSVFRTLPEFGGEPEKIYVKPGTRISDAVASAGFVPDDYGSIVVRVNGHQILRHVWHLVKLRPEGVRYATITVVPGKGGGEVLRTIALVAVAAVAVWVSAGAALPAVLGGGSLLAGGSFTALALAGGVTALGNFLVNTLIPPPKQKLQTAQEVDPTYSISAARNELAPDSFIQWVLGERRVFPRYGSRPYTLLEGDDQFAFMLFEIEGPCDISEMKIGNTAISEYQGVTTNVIESSLLRVI